MHDDVSATDLTMWWRLWLQLGFVSSCLLDGLSLCINLNGYICQSTVI